MREGCCFRMNGRKMVKGEFVLLIPFDVDQLLPEQPNALALE
jgi:hypothetical protein